MIISKYRKKLEERLIRNIKPFWLREKLFWAFFQSKENFSNGLFDNATLEFVPKIELKLMHTDISHKQIAYLGFIELEATKRVIKVANSGGLMIDVGANYGYYSCMWAAINSKNSVIAFEASPRNLKPLIHNIERNKLKDRVIVCGSALGKENSKQLFHLGPKIQTGWGGLTNIDNDKNIIVYVKSLDDFFIDKNYDLIDLLKIDVEGADKLVLEGSIELLRSKRIKHVIFEENIHRMQSLNINPGEAQRILTECGYSLEKLSKTEWYATCIN